MSEESSLLRATALSGYAVVVERYGKDPEQLLESAGLSTSLLTEPDLFMPFSRFMLLMEISAQETGNPLFGAELGFEQGLRVLGSIAYGMSTSKTLREAFLFITDNYSVQSTGNVVRLQQFNDKLALISTEIVTPTSFDVRQTLDNTLAVGIRMMKGFYGSAWQPIEVQLQHSLRESDRASYRRWFGENIQFDADITGFVFRAELVDAPLPGADSMAHKMFERQLQDERLNIQENFSARVKSVIHLAIPSGDVSIESAARTMAMSPRSMQRKLQEQDTSFQELVDVTRRQMAEHYLLSSKLQLTQIAELVGFSRVSNLTHAFRRWHGVSPTEWRKNKAV